jgi:zinc protease
MRALAATLAASLAFALACGPATTREGETTPTLPGDDPVARGGKGKPEKPKPAEKPAAADPWAGKKDLIQPPAAAPAAELALPQVERYVLPNGLVVLLVPSHDLPVVSLHLAVRAGASQETREKRGLADFVAAMLTKGTKKRSVDQLSATIDQVGGALGAGADFEATHVSCQVTAKNLATCLDLLPEVVISPSFDAKQVDEVRKQLEAAVKQRRTDPEALGEEHFENFLWGDDHVRGWPVTIETVDEIQQKDLVDWQAAYFKPNNAVLAIAGDFDPARLKPQLAAAFGGWKKGEVPEAKKFPEPKLDGVRVRLVDKPDQPQAHVIVGELGVAHGDGDWLATALMNYTLGGAGYSSRLAVALRARGIAASDARSQFDRYLSRGVFMAHAVTRSKGAVGLIKAIIAELGKMRDAGPTASELASAKGAVAGGYALGMESSQDVATAVLSAELHGLGLDYVRKLPVLASSVTLEAARAAAKAHLDPDNLVIVVVGPADEIAPLLDKAGLSYEKVSWLQPVSKHDRDRKAAAENGPPDPKKAAEGQKLLDQAVTARGGEKKLGAIKTLVQKGKLVISAPNGQTVGGDYARWFQAPNRWRTDMTVSGKGTITFVVDGATAWVRFNGQIQDIPAEALETLESVTYADPDVILLHAEEKGAIVVKDEPQKIDGKSYDAIRVRSPDGKHEAAMLLDPKTHLPYGVCFLVETETLCEEYGDYRAVGGLQVPYSIKSVSLILQGLPYEVKMDSVEINGKVPDDTFKK